MHLSRVLIIRNIKNFRTLDHCIVFHKQLFIAHSHDLLYKPKIRRQNPKVRKMKLVVATDTRLSQLFRNSPNE